MSPKDSFSSEVPTAKAMENVQRLADRRRTQVSSKRETSDLFGEDEDIVCSLWRHKAGVIAHRVKKVGQK